jgi:hypothetical protein
MVYDSVIRNAKRDVREKLGRANWISCGPKSDKKWRRSVEKREFGMAAYAAQRFYHPSADHYCSAFCDVLPGRKQRRAIALPVREDFGMSVAHYGDKRLLKPAYTSFAGLECCSEKSGKSLLLSYGRRVEMSADGMTFVCHQEK